MAKRVLVVDDEAAIVEGLTMLFELEELESAGAYDCDGAVLRLAEKHYPVVVTDLCLHTREEGIRLIEQIREMSPHSRIVVMTGYATPETEAELAERGTSMVLHKPMHNDAIVGAVRELLAEIERQAAEQSEVNLEELYLSARRVLHSIPMRKYRLTPEQAEDIVQEAWLLFLHKRGYILSPRAWLAGTVLNLCRQGADRDRRAPRVSIDGDLESFEPSTEMRHDEVLATRQALAQLDERSRMLCSLIAMEGLSYEEVSRTTGIPLGSIGPLYIRAKKKMRKILEQ
jgi:RNA polymerase sigma factor (sigma-70 family)